ncbi:galectin-9-like [Denticeps clupeoides]|uniref:galectin-9-like n=1 Tax=Denticeps clupeoides TaxID=299321 RepID=UPI0010A32C61|nr:galectin-9 [Denticeps clupeoides]
MALFPQGPFYNPKIPFTGSIVGGLQDGRSVVVTGRVLPGAQRFHVNLQCGSWPGAVIALHCNPRYDSGPSGYVVANAFQGSWGSEERKAPSPFPQGCPFTLMILVTPESYKIATNGNHFMEFRHRVPFNTVDTIVVDGKVEVNSIVFQGPSAAFPPQYFQPPQSNPYPPPFLPPAAYAVPYKTIINGGLYSGKTINIQGVVNPTAKRFSVNLQSRAGIVLHYNPRFDENVVVRNSFLGGVWGPEERGGGMPFHRGNAFTITVICNPQGYSVMLNGAQVHSFDHRHHNLQEIDVLEVSGDLSLTSVMA